MEIENQIIYLVLDPNYLFKKVSLNEWNELYRSYKNDPDAIVEEYNDRREGYVYITTNLYNILKNHSILDLRFNVGYRTKYHITDYTLQ